MYEVAWFPAAEEEFIASGLYYEERQQGLGVRFGQAVLEAVGGAVADPERYRLIGVGCRKVRVKWFPFVLVYRVSGRRIEIIAVAHGARKPGYWSNRSQKPE